MSETWLQQTDKTKEKSVFSMLLSDSYYNNLNLSVTKTTAFSGLTVYSKWDLAGGGTLKSGVAVQRGTNEWDVTILEI